MPLPPLRHAFYKAERGMGHNSGEMLYCSDKCVKAAHKVFVAKAVKARSEQRAAWRAKYNNECLMCGKPIQARRSTMQYCSIRCRVAMHRLDRR
jgi:hypothetical protein